MSLTLTLLNQFKVSEAVALIYFLIFNFLVRSKMVPRDQLAKSSTKVVRPSLKVEALNAIIANHNLTLLEYLRLTMDIMNMTTESYDAFWKDHYRQFQGWEAFDELIRASTFELNLFWDAEKSSAGCRCVTIHEFNITKMTTFFMITTMSKLENRRLMWFPAPSGDDIVPDLREFEPPDEIIQYV